MVEAKDREIGFDLGLRIRSGLVLLTSLEGRGDFWSYDQAGLSDA